MSTLMSTRSVSRLRNSTVVKRPSLGRGGLRVRRVAMLSVHTSPLHQPGTGDAGGMNVYILELARRLACLGTEVDVFTRRTSMELPTVVEAAPGVRVRHVTAGPPGPVAKERLPRVLPAFAEEVVRSAREEGARYDVVHAHYWLSGQAGREIAARWDVPLVHTMHTMAKVKNAALADGDTPEPLVRVLGEMGLADYADRLIANTAAEQAELVGHYGAATERTAVVHPGVCLDNFRPLDGRSAARRRLGLPAEALVVLFAGRIQPLKAPDVLLHAVAGLLRLRPALRGRLLVPVIGGLSGAGAAYPERCRRLAEELGVADSVSFRPPVRQADLADWYRAADVLTVPSHSESFGLVALEAQACGTPVLAAAVGGLPVAVRDGVTGLLVQGHDPLAYARALCRFADDPAWAAGLGTAAVRHAAGFGWEACARATEQVYAEARTARWAARHLVGAVAS
ncbi:D-inositol-3-phosphate glycosyltransferase [Kitasatospora sp. MMS16-BH015]|uniref:D-inositol-3-phosphate glycosyltransferase n=1 Tax=Kitasatospora sp. MMS16-BH015 TaxID=2018025 RepID=UPI00352F2E6C